MKTTKMLLIEEKAKKDIRNLLLELYIKKDMTYVEIINYFKKEINVDVSLGSLTTWFKVFEIPTRTWSLISKR